MISPAEFKTLRETLGLTSQWIANQVGVKLRSVQYWESGRSPVPEDVCSFLQNIEDKMDEMVNRGSEIFQTVDETQRPDEVVLLRYKSNNDLWRFQPEMAPLPATAHAAILGKLRSKLQVLGISTYITYMDPDSYSNWLGPRKDSSEQRAQWGALQK